MEVVANELTSVEKVPEVALKLVPVAEVKDNEVIVAPPILAFVAPKIVAKRPVEVALVEVVLVKIAAAGVVKPIVTPLIVPPESVALPEFKFVMVPLVTRAVVAKRFVLVVFVPVAFVQVMLVGEKFEADKFVNTPSTAKRRLPVAYEKSSVPTVLDPAAKFPVSVRFEPVAELNVAVWRSVVPVTVRFEMVAPPYSVMEDVAMEPRFVTERRVSASATADGQLVLSERQTVVLLMRVSDGRRA